VGAGATVGGAAVGATRRTGAAVGVARAIAAVGAAVGGRVGATVGTSGAAGATPAVGERGTTAGRTLAVGDLDGLDGCAVRGPLVGPTAGATVVPTTLGAPLVAGRVLLGVPKAVRVPGAVTVTSPRTTASTVRSGVGCGITVGVVLLAARAPPQATPSTASSTPASALCRGEGRRRGDSPAAGLIRLLWLRSLAPRPRPRAPQAEIPGRGDGPPEAIVPRGRAGEADAL